MGGKVSTSKTKEGVDAGVVIKNHYVTVLQDRNNKGQYFHRIANSQRIPLTNSHCQRLYEGTGDITKSTGMHSMAKYHFNINDKQLQLENDKLMIRNGNIVNANTGHIVGEQFYHNENTDSSTVYSNHIANNNQMPRVNNHNFLEHQTSSNVPTNKTLQYPYNNLQYYCNTDYKEQLKNYQYIGKNSSNNPINNNCINFDSSQSSHRQRNMTSDAWIKNTSIDMDNVSFKTIESSENSGFINDSDSFYKSSQDYLHGEIDTEEIERDSLDENSQIYYTYLHSAH